MSRLPPACTLFPYTTLFRSGAGEILVVASRRPSGDRLFAAVLDAALSRPERTWRLLAGGSDAESWLPWLRARASHSQVIVRSEEHTSELQSHSDLVCRLLLE